MRTILGTVNEIRIYRTAKKGLMAFVDIQTEHKNVEAVIFPKVFSGVINWVDVGQVVRVRGHWRITEEKVLLHVVDMNLG